MTNRHRDKRLFIHRIDPDDIVVYVNDAWLAFARENGAPELTNRKVWNNSLWDFIADYETRHLYQLLLEKVRRKKIAIRIPFRCDSPDRRRLMEMEIFPLEKGGAEFRTVMIKTEFREPVAVLDTCTDRSGKVVTICAWCKKINVPEKGWMETEKAVTDLHLFEAVRLPILSHGICPACREIIFHQID